MHLWLRNANDIMSTFFTFTFICLLNIAAANNAKTILMCKVWKILQKIYFQKQPDETTDVNFNLINFRN